MKIEKKYLMIILLFLGYLIVFIDKTVIGLAMIKIEKEFSLSPKEFGYITGVFFLSYSMFQIPAGWLNDRIGYKKVLILSLSLLGGFAICFGALGFSFGLLLAFRFLSGVGHSGYPCSCAKAVSSNFEVEERTFAQSVLLSSSGVAMIVGPIAVGYLLDTIGWRGSFTGLGIVAFAIAILIWLLVPNPVTAVATKQEKKSSYLALLKNPVVVLLFIAIFGVNIPAYGLMAWLPKYMMQARGLDLHWAAYILAIGGLSQWLSSLVSGWFVGRYMQDREHLVIFISSLIAACCIWMVYFSPNIVLAIVFLFIGYLFLMTSFVTSFTLPMKRLPQDVIGSVMGLINTGGTLGGFISPIVIGYLVSSSDNTMSGDFAMAFAFLSSGMLLSALVVLPLKKKPVAASA